MTRTFLRCFMIWVLCGVAWMAAPYSVWAEQVVQAVVDRGSTGNSIPVQIKNISQKEPIKNIIMEVMEHSPSFTGISVTPEILSSIPSGGTGSFDVRFNVSEEAIPGAVSQIKFLLLTRRGRFETPNPVLRIQIRPEEEEEPPPPPPEVEPGPGGLPVFVLSEIKGKKSFRYAWYEMEWDGKSTGHVERWRTKRGKKALTDIRTSVITQYPQKIVLGKPFSFTAQAHTRHFNLQHCWRRGRKHDETFANLGLRSHIATVDVRGSTDLSIFCDEAGVFKTGRDGRQHRTSVRSIHKDGQVQATLKFVPTEIIRDDKNRPVEFHYKPQLTTSGESNDYSGLKERRFYSLNYEHFRRAGRKELVIDSAGYFQQADELVWLDSISFGIIDLKLKYLPATRSMEPLSPPQFKGREDLSDFSPGEGTGEPPAPGEIVAQTEDSPAPEPDEDQPGERATPPSNERVLPPEEALPPAPGETITESGTRPKPSPGVTGETGETGLPVEERPPSDEIHFVLAGPWKFGRVNGPFLCDITLTLKMGEFGNIIKACHPNESFWSVENGELIFKNKSGAVMSRLKKENENHWKGPYLSDSRITHYITRDKDEGQTSQEIDSAPRSKKGMEHGFDRMGSDYKDFWLPSADPSLCRDACYREDRCKAWTYVKPEVREAQGRCWLKNKIPPSTPNDCCVSGIKGREQTSVEFDSDLVGPWKFGRVSGPFLCDITLTLEKGEFGNIIKACHPNESFWSVENEELVFLNKSGAVMSRFKKENENHWKGPYLSDSRITHYITRDKKPSRTPTPRVTQERYECSVDNRYMSGSNRFCDQLVEHFGDKKWTHHIINKDKYKDKSFKIPKSWKHGRFNTCEVLHRDSNQSCANWKRRN